MLGNAGPIKEQAIDASTKGLLEFVKNLIKGTNGHGWWWLVKAFGLT